MSEPPISSPSSPVYVEQGGAAGVCAGGWDEKWTAKLRTVSESLPFGPLLAGESSEQGSGRVTSVRRPNFFAGLSTRVAIILG